MRKATMYKILICSIFICALLPIHSISQSMGIGITNPKRALLEVHGASGVGTTSAMFGGEHGISFLKDFPAIGFNMYRDSTTSGYRGRKMNIGYSSMISMNYDDALTPAGFVISSFPNGAAGSVLPSGTKMFAMFDFQFTINTTRLATETPASLMVGRGTGIDGTAAFSGTTFTSFFNFRTAENTYIRGGRSGSRVFINDLYKGDIIIGSTGSRVGVNAPDPQYPFEVRQINGTGIKMILNRIGVEYSWEWRVGSNPYHLYAYYNNAATTSFSNIDGTLTGLSDKRLKKNIESLPSLIDRLVLLEPVTYEMKDDNPTHFRTTGFVAQQVDELFPQLVVKGGATDMLSIKYAGFHVLAIKGIQEEQLKINAIEQQSLEIERKMKLLESSLPATNRQTP